MRTASFEGKSAVAYSSTTASCSTWWSCTGCCTDCSAPITAGTWYDNSVFKDTALICFRLYLDATSTVINGHAAAAASKDGQVPGVYHHSGLGPHMNHPQGLMLSNLHAIHPSSIVQRYYIRIFLTFHIISDWCLSALIAICDWYCQLVRRQEDHLIVYRLLTLVQWKYTWYYQVSTNYLLGDRVLGTAKSQQTLQIKYKSSNSSKSSKSSKSSTHG